MHIILWQSKLQILCFAKIKFWPLISPFLLPVRPLIPIYQQHFVHLKMTLSPLMLEYLINWWILWSCRGAQDKVSLGDATRQLPSVGDFMSPLRSNFCFWNSHTCFSWLGLCLLSCRKVETTSPSFSRLPFMQN